MSEVRRNEVQTTTENGTINYAADVISVIAGIAAAEIKGIAAMSGGVPQLDVGPNTDVLDGCAKEAGLRWMLRAMSPQALVTDELGGAMDAQAVLDAARSGVSVLATLHGRDLQAALSRGILYHLAQNRVFDRYALLDENEVGCVRAVCDEQLRPLEAP